MEIDPVELTYSVRASIQQALETADSKPKQSAGWDRVSGQPLCPAIAGRFQKWETAAKLLAQSQVGESIRSVSGLPMLPLYSGMKLKWLIDHDAVLKKALASGNAVVGTVDTWFLYHLTGKSALQTDYSNAFQTQLLNPESLEWDDFLMREFGVRKDNLPTLAASAGEFGKVAGFLPLEDGTPIVAMAADQAVALIGSDGRYVGSTRAHFGEWLRVMIHGGQKYIEAREGGLPVVLAMPEGVGYGVEMTGVSMASILPLLNGLGVRSTNGVEPEMSAQDLDALKVIPSYPDPFYLELSDQISLSVMGLKTSVSAQQLVAAGYKAMMHQTKWLVGRLETNFRMPLKELVVSGLETADQEGLQYLADLLQVPVINYGLPQSNIAGMASLMSPKLGGFFSEKSLKTLKKVARSTVPVMDPLTSYTVHKAWDTHFKQLNPKGPLTV